MDYVLQPRPETATGVSLPGRRITPPRRTSQLRKGGGRKDAPGWTEHKRRSNRQRFENLRPYIRTAVTIIYPSSATPHQLQSLNECNRNFCKEQKIPARAVWEGPGKHQHIALGVSHDIRLEGKWERRLAKRWKLLFGQSIPPNSFLWKADEKADQIASYLIKTRESKTGRYMTVKAQFSWLTFSPVWETGFRAVVRRGPLNLELTNAVHIQLPEKRNDLTPSPEKESGRLFHTHPQSYPSSAWISRRALFQALNPF